MRSVEVCVEACVEVCLEVCVEVCLEELLNNDIVIVSTVSDLISMREYARKNLPDFYEIFLDVDPKICAERDYKGLYIKAEKDQKIVFPGVSEMYEEYNLYDLKLQTGFNNIKDCSDRLYDFVSKKIVTL